MQIRKAKADDAEAIVDIAIKSWISTYSKFFSPEVFKRREQNRPASEKWWKEHLSSNHNAYVAVDGDKVVGFMDFNPQSRTMPAMSELGSIYILKEYQHKGLGKRLFNKAITLSKKFNKDKMMLNVLQQNSAINFYKKLGGVVIGSRSITVGGEEFKEAILSIDVGAVEHKIKFKKSDGIKISLKRPQLKQISSKKTIAENINKDNILAFDIYDNATLIGFAMLRKFEKRRFFLWDYAIDKRFQNKGLGSIALAALIDLLKTRYNCQQITTTVIFGNEQAIHLYQKFGFVQTEIINEGDVHEINMMLNL